MNEQITLKSGAMLELQMAPFADGMNLFKVIVNEVKQVDVDLSGLDVAGLASKDLNSIKNLIFQLLGSDAVERCFFLCAARCLHNGQKITKATFEPAESRGDYLPTAWEVIKFNIAPFFSGLDLSSLTKSKPTPLSRP